MFVFLHVPKTAGSTFRLILENSFGQAACHTNHAKKELFDASDLAFARKVFPWLRSLAGHNLLDPLSLPIGNPFCLTFLRGPVVRVTSHYQDSVMNGDNQRTFPSPSMTSFHGSANALGWAWKLIRAAVSFIAPNSVGNSRCASSAT